MVTAVYEGEALHGMVVRVVARAIDQPRYSEHEKSHRHGRMFTVARDTVVCTIEQPHRWAVGKKRPEEKKENSTSEKK